MLKLFQRLLRGLAWLGVAALVVVAAGFGGRTLLAQEEAAPAARPLPVAVFEARYQDTYRERRLFSGRVAPAQVADAGFQIGGEVAEVLVSVGDRVAKGDGLAKLDPVRIELRRNEAAAQLAEAKALARRADQTRARVSELLDQGFATDQEFDDAVASAVAANERVRLLTRALSRISEDARDAILKAPFDGFIVERFVDAGATVAAGQPVVRINQQAAFEAEIGVSSDLITGVLPGDTFELVADGVTVEGTVDGISDDVDPLTRSQIVRLRIDNDAPITPGSLIRLALDRERQARGVWVPMAALQESYRGLWSVYVVESTEGVEEIRRKDVEIISLSDDRVFVTGTLEDGDRIVATSPFRFVPGQKVDVKTELPPSASLTAIASSVVN
ncbi:MAG: efflux RND transporter periplasmic adaptor subunit [Pseudomonadota bacterium]